MLRSFIKFLLGFVATTIMPWLLVAGTLDDVPFRVVVPSAQWKIDDSTAKAMGKDVFLVATVTDTNTLLKSVIIKTVLKETSNSALDQLCAGIRDSFSHPAVKKISDADATFLGHKARTFAYQVTQGDQTTYNEATVFVVGNTGWTIACVGRPDQKNEVKRIFTFYQPKAT